MAPGYFHRLTRFHLGPAELQLRRPSRCLCERTSERIAFDRLKSERSSRAIDEPSNAGVAAGMYLKRIKGALQPPHPLYEVASGVSTASGWLLHAYVIMSDHCHEMYFIGLTPRPCATAGQQVRRF